MCKKSSGSELIEYGIALALVSVVSISAYEMLGKIINDIYKGAITEKIDAADITETSGTSALPATTTIPPMPTTPPVTAPVTTIPTPVPTAPPVPTPVPMPSPSPSPT